MIGIHKGRLVNWCNNNVDLLIIAAGAVILFSANQLRIYRDLNPMLQDIGFWTLLIGVVTLSAGTSALICYRIILKWRDEFFS